MPNTTKPLVDPAETQQSLLRLREELLTRLEQLGQDIDISLVEVVFKINSCLFSKYPDGG